MSDHSELRRLARVGIHYPDTIRHVTTGAADYAMDAANLNPLQITASNGGVPAFLTTWIDPRAIDILLAPMAAAKILGEVKKGDWATTTAMFRTVEPGGQVATYGDWSPNGMSTSNTNYPSRESYTFQTWIEYGDRELAMAGEGYIDLAGDKQYASALVMAKAMNRIYLYGVAGLKNYGLTNDPSLTAPVAATVNYATASPEDIANDFVRQVAQLVAQSNGIITGNEAMVWASAPSALVNLDRTNSFGLSARKKIAETYPNIEFVAVPEYDTAAGRLAQLWVKELDGRPTGELGFTEKERSHAVERYSSNTRQKKSGGSWGAIIYRPFAVGQTLGI